MVQVQTDARGSSAADRSVRVATIDVGSNSVRLLVADLHPDGTYRLVDDEKEVTRLGRGTAHGLPLADAAMADSVRTIRHMREIAEGYEVSVLRAVATCAVREAANRDEFVDLVRERAGVELRVIDGAEEARLAWLSVRNAFDVGRREAAVVDIGGGSTEVVLGAYGIVRSVESNPIGAVRLAELVPERTDPRRRLEEMREVARSVLRLRLARESRPQVVIGTGGTFTTLAMIHLLAQRRTTPEDLMGSIRGHAMNRAEVRRLLENLAAMTPDERLAVPGLGPDRVDIIVPGLVIAETMMRRLGTNRLEVHDRGIRDGLLISLAAELFPDAPAAATEQLDRIAAARRFAERCGYERAHCEHVTRLALSIHDQLEAIAARETDLAFAPRGLDARALLETAGILHDIGYYIDYARHHKHSLHLVLHSDLPGFSHRELRIVANVARYHRRAHPKRGKHREFAALGHRDQVLVRRLAAVLRIADGLDRAHRCLVERVELVPEGRTMRILVDAPLRPEVELWGAERKSQLFADVFGRIPRLDWRPGAGAATDGTAAG